jgi:predicted ATPase
MIGHRLVGMSLLHTGDIAEGRMHFNHAIAFYNPAAHRRLATRFGQDLRVEILCYRSFALWMLGYPEAALADAEHALKDAREIGHAATLMYTLANAAGTHFVRRNNEIAKTLTDELIALSDEKGSPYWRSIGMMLRGLLFAVTGNASNAVQMITSSLAAFRLTGSTWSVPTFLTYLASVYAELGQFDDARRSIDEAITAIETTKETWRAVETHCAAGQIELESPEHDLAKAETYFESALSVARQQQAKSWELRAAMSMARLWRDQGKRKQARELLAPVYGWFTEGFDTLDLKDAKALLDELNA